MTEAGKWIPVIGLILFMSLLQLIGPELFRFETSLITGLELWRVFTGHWVHANWVHYLLNMAGFILCLALTGVKWSIWQWVWRILILSLGISLGFYVLHPEVSWYVGFSGVLFGLYVLTAYASFSDQAFMSGILLLFIGVKIILEQWSSVNITTSDLIGVPVLVDAHLYGVLIAILLVVAQIIYRKIFHSESLDSDSI